MTDRFDIAIVGGGTAGLASAIFAKESRPDRSVVVLDGARKLGAKILVSGGGRCNVTHHRVTPDDYFGPRNRIKNVLAAFTVEQTVAWFESLGVMLKREPTGKLFPVTDDAATILDALLTRCDQSGVTILTDHRVTDVTRRDGGFVIRSSHRSLHAPRLILATGGRSLPKTGSDGGGYALAQALGHTITPTAPALVPLLLDDAFFHKLVTGIAHDVTLTTRLHGKTLDRRTGSLLWTHFGVSGPVVMDASRCRAIHPAAVPHVNLLPSENFDSLEAHLIEQARHHTRRTLSRVVGERLPQRVAEALLNHLGLDPQREMGRLTREDRRALAHGLTDLKLPVTGDRGWNHAEVTAGGVPLEEVDTATMQSRVTANLHLIGEMLDVDGRIGGFNFQWAWCTARIAARSAVSGAAAPAAD